MIVTKEQAIAATEQWIREVVVGLNLCPFAAPVVESGKIFYAVSEAFDEESIYRDMLMALDEFQQCDEASKSTGFFVISQGLKTFNEFNEFMTLVDQAIIRSGLDGVIQMVGFHPEMVFAETEEADPANYTNRSPYPMLHMIREDDLEAAVASHPDPASIPDRNIRLLREMGLDEVRAMLERCYPK